MYACHPLNVRSYWTEVQFLQFSQIFFLSFFLLCGVMLPSTLRPQHIPIFTDGSKLSNHTAAAVVFKSHIITKRLPNSVSIYTAELYAILQALNELSKQQHKHYLLFSDSLSSLNSIGNKKLDHPITLQIILKYHNLFTHSYNIIFCWLPSHAGITGNEKADKAAKSALNKPIL